MSNDFYAITGAPGQRSTGSSAAIRAEFAALQAAFDKMPALSSTAFKVWRTNTGGTGAEAVDLGTLLTALGSLTLTGPVGIGGAPTNKLDVFHTVNGIGARLRNTSTGVELALRTDATTSGLDASNVTGGMTFGFNMVEKFRITPTGTLQVGTDQVLPTNGYNISAAGAGGAIELRGSSATINRGWRIGMRDNGAGFAPHLSYLESSPNQLGVNTTFVLNPAVGSEAARITNDGGYITGHNSANTTRTGYLQFNTGSTVLLAAEGTVSLGFLTNSTERMRITADGRIYGSALHNNGGSVSGTTNQYIASGTYTPTLTANANSNNLTASQCQWVRVGNVVTVSGQCVAGTPASGVSSFGMTVPIASNFITGLELGGSGSVADPARSSIGFSADTVNDRASCNWTAVGTGTIGFQFAFTYEVK